jgi:hypothetical protein
MFVSRGTRKKTLERTHVGSTVYFANGGSSRTARRLHLVGTLVLLVAIPALAATASTAEVAATLVLNPAQLEFGQHEGYDLVSIEGAVHTTDPAEPMLPAFHVRLLLPPGSDCSEIETFHGGTVRIPGTYDILPAPRPVRLSQERASEIPQPLKHVYDSDSPYPRTVARLAGVGSLGGFRIATVIVTPLQYIPATGELLLHTHIEVSAATEPSSEADERTCPAAPGLALLDAVRATVANGEALSAYAAAQLAGGSRGTDTDYLIVCARSFSDEFAPLADWKTRKGVRASIITVEDVVDDPVYSGVDEAESIRNCIRHYSIEHGTLWVLLAGDTDLIPARLVHDSFFDQGLPCDLYYADLDGDWDSDGDAIWGEVEDGVDMYSDVLVGRAPVSTEAEASAFVERVLAYEGAATPPTSSFQREMLLLGEIMWDYPDPYTDGGVALDMIHDECVPPRFDPVTRLYERDGTLSASSVIDALSTGSGIVIHQGHADIGHVSLGDEEMTIADLDALENGYAGGLWYSVGCWSAAIDHDAFAEHWVTNAAGGGIAYVGNARYGWGCPGYPGQCVSDLYGREFFVSLFERELSHAGLVHADAKHQFVGSASADDYMRYAMYELNLLGDPETPIWTDAPSALTVIHPGIVTATAGKADVSVEVQNDGAPVAGATVCVSSEDFSAYTVAETDASGRARTTLITGDSTELLITVTAADCMPNCSTTRVVDSETGVDGGGVSDRVAALSQNSPNPFTASTRISFSTAERGPLVISVYDVTGRRVRTLVNRRTEAGRSSVEWDGQNETGEELPSGVYFVRMEAGHSLFERKMTLLR